MTKLTVHIVGTGAIGLAYGYLLTACGHTVFHTSLRGQVFGPVPVQVATSTGALPVTTQAIYEPRYRRDATEDPIVNATIFAVHSQDLLLALSQWGGAQAGSPSNLIFCSHPSPIADEWRNGRAANCVLVYPLISAESSSDHGLSIVTNREVELCLPPGSAMGEWVVLGSLFQQMGLVISSYATSQRLHVRSLQTSAVYIVLVAVSSQVMDRSTVNATKLLSIFDMLLAMDEHTSGACTTENAHRLVPDHISQFELLAPLIAGGAHAAQSAEDLLLASNIDYLLRYGRRKLLYHLQGFAHAWGSYIANCPPSFATSTHKTISLALGQCQQV